MISEKMNKSVMKTGTTTIGIVCKEGIILAADKRMSAGYMVADRKTDKVIPLNDDFAVTTAGLVSDAQLLVKIIKVQMRLESIKRGKPLLAKEVANMLSSLVYGNVRRMSMVHSVVGFLLGGKDEGGHHLYSLGIDGSVIEFDDYYADGSGTMFALGVLQANYKKGITIDNGVKLAVQAVNTAIQRDMASGDGIDVWTITSKGVQKVLHKEVSSAVIV